MAEKDIRKLKRQDLLELLILQSREVIRLQAETEAKGEAIEELTSTNERLKEKLNEKDAQMDDQNARLTGKLNDKDAQMGRLAMKLSDKDQQIDRLKTRLDQKDAKILKLEAQISTGATRDPDDDNTDMMMQRIYEAAQMAVGDFLKRQAGEKEAGLPAYMTGKIDDTQEEPEDSAPEEEVSAAETSEAETADCAENEESDVSEEEHNDQGADH